VENITDEVGKILGKQEFKGFSYYLLKWKEYGKVGDRTWKPCDSLTVAVPRLLDM
jgi:hypothetical protein